MVLNSMTGFATGTSDINSGTLSIEMRSVNSRFLDLHFRIGEELRQCEPALRELITKHVKRGKLECRVYFNTNTTQNDSQTISPDVLQRVKAMAQAVLLELPEAKPLSVYEILRWPGIMSEQVADPSQLPAKCLELATSILSEFNASRSREGAKLADIIRARVADMRTIVNEVEPLIPAAQQAYQAKLRQRLEEVLSTADEDRIRQEVGVFALRIDVAEEIGRLRTHLDEVERILSSGGASGKRLDFLMQELNREANTLGSKSMMSEVSQAAIELKILIEQMREQIQNLE